MNKEILSITNILSSTSNTDNDCEKNDDENENKTFLGFETWFGWCTGDWIWAWFK